MKVVIVGGGWAGCAAAIVARKQGAEIEIYEKTDMLLGLGNVGGIMRNNGRFTAAEELKALGAPELIDICDKCSRHKNIEFPGHKGAWLYDVNKIEPMVRKKLLEMGIKLNFISRVIDVVKEEKQESDDKNNFKEKLKAVVLSDGKMVLGDVFIEATGSTGPMGNCLRYGNGCVMCILRCPTFGPRVSLSYRAGVDDLQGMRDDDVFGAMSGSCKLTKETISDDIVNELNEKGVVVIKLPSEDVNLDKLKSKVCQQYALKEFAENIILLDTGHAKLMTTFYPLEKLRKIKGLENVKFADPYSGGVGNSIRYLSVAPRNDDMQVKGIENLFCCGEKGGLFVGHTEAIITGSLAGYNSIRYTLKMPSLILPRTTAIGDIIAYANYQMETKEGRKRRYTFAGSDYFKRMVDNGLFTTDIKEIEKRISDNKLLGIFNKKLI